MSPDEMMTLALDTAEHGMTTGELPIGAVVTMGEDVVGRAFTQDRTCGRRLVHADLLAMTEADERLGWSRRPHPLRLAVTLEPCVMCLGAAMSLGVEKVVFALESPGDGAADVATSWTPREELPWYRAPAIVAGVDRTRSRDLFRRYCVSAPDSGLRRWAQTLADLPDEPVS